MSESLPDTSQTGGAVTKDAATGGAAARRRPKTIMGIVTSDKMQKTRSVRVTRLEPHRKYGKYLRRRTIYKAHDENEVSGVGDTVRIAETRPLSKTKRWRVVEIVTHSRFRSIPASDMAASVLGDPIEAEESGGDAAKNDVAKDAAKDVAKDVAEAQDTSAEGGKPE